MTKLSKKKVLKAMDGTGGIITVIAKKCGVTRQHMSEYINASNELKEAVLHEREKMVDLAEVGLYHHVKKKDLSAIKYVMGRRSVMHGFGETQKHELTGKNGGPIETKLSLGVDGATLRALAFGNDK